jgi:hypothetical protein
MPIFEKRAASALAGWEHYSHCADIGVRGFGRSVEELFLRDQPFDTRGLLDTRHFLGLGAGRVPLDPLLAICSLFWHRISSF